MAVDNIITFPISSPIFPSDYNVDQKPKMGTVERVDMSRSSLQRDISRLLNGLNQLNNNLFCNNNNLTKKQEINYKESSNANNRKDRTKNNIILFPLKVKSKEISYSNSATIGNASEVRKGNFSRYLINLYHNQKNGTSFII